MDMEELSVSFEYITLRDAPASPPPSPLPPTTAPACPAAAVDAGNSHLLSSPAFKSVSVAAMNANLTLPNTELGQGVVRDHIQDSPTTLRHMEQSPEAPLILIESFVDRDQMEDASSPSARPMRKFPRPRSEVFRALDPSTEPATEAASEASSSLDSLDSSCDRSGNSHPQLTAGGAAGEDRVQVVCSPDNSLLFCAIFDGFNGRDAADFLSVTLFARFSENLTESHLPGSAADGGPEPEPGLVGCALSEALQYSEAAFLGMVERHVAEDPGRQDLAMVGSCVLVVLVYGQRLYTMSLGDSRAVLGEAERGGREVAAVQLTAEHVVSNQREWRRLAAEHGEEAAREKLVVHSRVKGKLHVTRAVGAGYLKRKDLNDQLLGIFKVKDFRSPPYISVEPEVHHRRIREGKDLFVVMGSDGLFDFFSNDEVVKHVNHCLCLSPPIDPARFLLTEFLLRVAKRSDMSLESLRGINHGRRRDYHDDVTVMVVTLGTNHHDVHKASVSPRLSQFIDSKLV